MSCVYCIKYLFHFCYLSCIIVVNILEVSRVWTSYRLVVFCGQVLLLVSAVSVILFSSILSKGLHVSRRRKIFTQCTPNGVTMGSYPGYLDPFMSSNPPPKPPDTWTKRRPCPCIGIWCYHLHIWVSRRNITSKDFRRDKKNWIHVLVRVTFWKFQKHNYLTMEHMCGSHFGNFRTIFVFYIFLIYPFFSQLDMPNHSFRELLGSSEGGVEEF